MKQFPSLSKRFGRKAKPASETPEETGMADDDTDAPIWDLSSLYPGLDSPELAADQESLAQLVKEFSEAYEGGVTFLSGAALGHAIAEFEVIDSMRCKINNYMALLNAENRNNFSSTVALKKWVETVEEDIAFFKREIGDMKEADLITKLVAPELAQYAPWIATQRTLRSHALPPAVEGIGEQFQCTNTEAWRRLYAELMADLQADFKGRRMPFEELSSYTVDFDLPRAERDAARQKMAEVLKQESKRAALIYNVLIKDMAIDAKLKKYDRPDQGMHLENNLSPEIVDTMVDTVKSSFTALSHQFYAWKTARHGAESMKYMELMEKSQESDAAANKFFSWHDARRTVLRAFRKFHPRFARIAQKFFDQDHIDAQVRDQKDSGAFMMPVDAGNLPFILLNFSGGVYDVVSLLGHELGHGIHQVLAEKMQGAFLSEMSPSVAETASVFSEMLVFEELFQTEKDPQVRQALLAERLENMLGNSLQQLSYYDFERRVHNEAKKGELSAERISDIWVETQKEYYGPAIELDEYDRYYWMMVPHFFDMPFYVYSYSFAQMAVSALYQEYKRAEQEGPEAVAAFKQNYIELLESGTSKNSYEMFAPFCLDPELPAFWENGLSLMKKYLDDLVEADRQKPVLAPKKPSLPPPGP